MTRKRILFLTPQLPYPPHSGGTIKSNEIISYLCRHYDVHFACLLKRDDEEHAEAFFGDHFFASVTVHRCNIPRTRANWLKSLWRGIPLSLLRNDNPAMISSLKLLEGQFDIIVCDHYLMFQYASLFKVPIILHQHNIEFVMWERYADGESSWKKKILARLEARRIRRYERKICHEAKFVLAAPNDIAKLRSLAPHAHFVETLHLGDERQLEIPVNSFEELPLHLLTIGTLSWEANRHGLKWFLENGWPILKEKVPELHWDIIGRGADQELIDIVKQLEGVSLKGFAEDLTPYYENTRLFLAPLTFGSGIKVKVINAMYRALPVATTSIGAEGIDVRPDFHLICEDDAVLLAEKIAEIILSPERLYLMGKAARKLMQKKYTWDVVFKNLEEAIQNT